MEAGRKLDETIAEKIFGWKKIPGQRFLNHQTVSQYHFAEPIHLVPPHIYERFVKNHKPLDGSSIESPNVPNYSTDLVEAWKVLETIFNNQLDSLGRRWKFNVENTPYGYHCSIEFAHHKHADDTYYWGEGKTVSEAICLAVLNMYEDRDLANRMEQAAIASMANFGTPDCWYCGSCGEKFVTVESIEEHSLKNPNGECDHV